MLRAVSLIREGSNCWSIPEYKYLALICTGEGIICRSRGVGVLSAMNGGECEFNA